MSVPCIRPLQQLTRILELDIITALQAGLIDDRAVGLGSDRETISARKPIEM